MYFLFYFLFFYAMSRLVCHNPLEEVQSLKNFGLTISHDLSWANHTSKLASKDICCQNILHRAESFLGTPEILSTDKAFIHSLMEYCSPIWAGATSSHLAQHDAVEIKAFKIIGISNNEAEFLGLSLSHRTQVGFRQPPFWS